VPRGADPVKLGRGDRRLVLRGLQPLDSAVPIDLTVRSGEILGIAGLLGSGRTELLRAIFGADPVAAGRVEVDGVPVPPNSPRRAVQAGLGLLTEDRKQLGLLLELTIRENASIAQLPQISRMFLVDRREERRTVDRYLGGLRLRAGSWEQPVSSLSGGNQQKVLLARPPYAAGWNGGSDCWPAWRARDGWSVPGWPG
jgi:ABC-type sugar transport system ATPase subunit